MSSSGIELGRFYTLKITKDQTVGELRDALTLLPPQLSVNIFALLQCGKIVPDKAIEVNIPLGGGITVVPRDRKKNVAS
jgi:hypothetical protein